MTLRVLITVTHLLGAGHLTRAAALASAFGRAGHAATLVSGGMPNRLVPNGPFEVVQLPPVRTAVGDFRILLDAAGDPAGADLIERRRHLLLDAYRACRPDVVVTELFPFGRRGLAAEHLHLLDAVRATRPTPLLLASIRDVLVAPLKQAKVAETHALVAERYDGVLVHGEEAILPLEASWPVDDRLRTRLNYTGYVDAEASGADGPPAGDDGSVLVSGGSSAASLPLYRTALAAARGSARRWRILVGQGVGEDTFRELGGAAPPNVVTERTRPDFRALLSNAAVFVGQAGYNTVMDIVATQARPVLVPFELGRETEQRLRADALAARGLALVLPESGLNPGSLAAAVEQAARRPRALRPAFRRDGAATAVALVERMAAAERAA